MIKSLFCLLVQSLCLFGMIQDKDGSVFRLRERGDVDEFITLQQGAVATGFVEDRRSKFYSFLTRISSEAEAQIFLSEIKATHHDARHHVYAWILDAQHQRAADDGEPARTSGEPTRQQLEGAHMQQVMCVIVRYFGGILLGPGGLKRAYSDACKEAIKDATEKGFLRRRALKTRLTYRLGYDQLDSFKALAMHNECVIADQAFSECVHLGLLVDPERTSDVQTTLYDAFHGRITLVSTSTQAEETPCRDISMLEE